MTVSSQNPELTFSSINQEYYPHLLDEVTEAQRDQRTFPNPKLIKKKKVDKGGLKFLHLPSTLCYIFFIKEQKIKKFQYKQKNSNVQVSYNVTMNT